MVFVVKYLQFVITLFILSVILLTRTIDAKNILFVLPIATQSHKNLFDPIVLGLAKRGHQITVLSPFPSKHKLPENVHEIVPVVSSRGSFKDDFKLTPLEMRAQGSYKNILFWGIEMNEPCEETFQNPQVYKLITNPKQHFDLIFMNGNFNQCFWGLVYHFHSPFIILTTMPSPMFTTRYTGNYYPLSYVPASFLNLNDHMSFGERLWNFVATYFTNYLVDKKTSINEYIYRKYLGSHIPSLDEIGQSVSLIMSNEHYIVTYPRPNFVDTVPIGGIHCRPSKPIANKELEDFISGAEHGFIYFSLGSLVEPDHLPETTLKMFIDVFSRLKQRIIWKWGKNFENLPSNVKISQWLPQQDILGHRNIKLFITHGGLLSTMESVYHGVPLVGIPIFVDQDLNLHHAQSQGYALKLEILNITEEAFESSIRRVLHEPTFADNVKKLSVIFRDQMETPLERAIYWSEYVMKHNGTAHLHSAARQLNFAQLHSLDVISFLAGIVVLILFVVYFVVIKVLRRLQGSLGKQKTQ